MELKHQNIIKDYLKKILIHPLFHKSNRLKELLSYIVEKSLSEEKNDIKELTLAIDVFGLSSTFDTSDNAKIRVAVYKLRKKLNQYYETDGKRDELWIEIPQGKYIATFSFSKHHRQDTQASKKIELDVENMDQAFIHLHFNPINNLDAEDSLYNTRVKAFSSSILNYLKDYSTIEISYNISNCDFDLFIFYIMEEEDLIIFLTIEDFSTNKIVWDKKIRFNNKLHLFFDWMDINSYQLAQQIGSSLGILFKRCIERPDTEKSVYAQLLSDFIRPIYTMDFADLNKAIEKIPLYGENTLNDHGVEGGVSHLYSMGYLLDIKSDPDYLHNSCELYNRALMYDPDNLFALLSRTRINQLQNAHQKLKEDTEHIIKTYGNYSIISPHAAYYNAMASGEWEKQMFLIRQIIMTSPEYPKFIHTFLFLYEMRRGNLNKALSEFREMPYSMGASYQILSISLFAKMDRMEEVHHIIRRNKLSNPDFELNTERHLSFIKGDAQLSNSIEQGITKASNLNIL